MLDSGYLEALLGANSRRVPAWMFIQEAGDGVVSFIGGSRVADPHPLRYGSERTHQLLVGEMIVRPRTVLHTDKLRGQGLPGLATGGFVYGDFTPDDLILGPFPEELRYDR